MARLLRMPGVAANATEALLAEWLVTESGDFAGSDPIASVETEKAAVDVEADAPGRLLKTLVPPGAHVEVGAPIAVLGEPGEQVDDLDALLTSLGVSPASDVDVPERRVTNGRIFASPLARKIAHDGGLTLAEVHGTGPRGRILRRDVDAALAGRDTATKKVPPRGETVRAQATDSAYEEIPHSRIRRATARRLTESKRTIPHFYLRATVRVEALLALRAEINEDTEQRISLNDLVVKAVGVAHRRAPEMNVTWSDDSVRRYRAVDVAVAVATEHGLMTPVVRGVEGLRLTALAAKARDLGERAHAGTLKQQELEGGSITVTNLGMFGVTEFGAIINPPHAAILAVGAVHEEPVVDDGTVVPGQVMTLTLSVDHRPVDGVVAARWMTHLVGALQRPVRLLV